MFEIVSGLNSVERTNSEEAERAGGRISEKREKGAMITLISLYLRYFNMRDMAISPKYNYENLQGLMYSVINGKSPKMP